MRRPRTIAITPSKSSQDPTASVGSIGGGPVRGSWPVPPVVGAVGSAGCGFSEKAGATRGGAAELVAVGLPGGVADPLAAVVGRGLDGVGPALGVTDAVAVAAGVLLAVADGLAAAVAEGLAEGVAEGLAEGVVEGLAEGLADGLGVGAAAAVMLVVMATSHLTTLPPGLPVPLHWLTRRAIAGLTVDPPPTEQSTVPPPPLAEPLHWVTVALVVVAGKGEQLIVPPPPPPEPLHWFTVAAVTGSAPGVSALMLLVTSTRHVVGCAASLPELLH